MSYHRTSIHHAFIFIFAGRCSNDTTTLQIGSQKLSSNTSCNHQMGNFLVLSRHNDSDEEPEASTMTAVAYQICNKQIYPWDHIVNDHVVSHRRKSVDPHVINDRISFAAAKEPFPTTAVARLLQHQWEDEKWSFFISSVVLMMSQAVCTIVYSNEKSCEPWKHHHVHSSICTSAPFAVQPSRYVLTSRHRSIILLVGFRQNWTSSSRIKQPLYPPIACFFNWYLKERFLLPTLPKSSEQCSGRLDAV